MTKNYIEAQLRLIHNLAEQAVKVSHDLFDELTTETTDQDAMIDQLNRLNGGEIEGIDEFVREFMDEFVPGSTPDGGLIHRAEVCVEGPESIELRVSTGKGEVLPYVYPADYGTVCCGVSYCEKDSNTEIDLCLVEVKKGPLAEIPDNEDVDIYVYGDPYSEEFTDKKVLKHEDIVKALSDNDEEEEPDE